jgi:hypothetical protein
MATTKKALELAAELADELRKRVSDYASITESSDASGNPLITLNADASPATTEDVVVIRVRPRTWELAKDVLGTAQTVYTPHVIDVATEVSGVATGIMDYVSVAHALQILTSCAKRGTRLELWEETNGTIPSETTFATAAKMKASIEAELYWPLLSSQ